MIINVFFATMKNILTAASHRRMKQFVRWPKQQQWRAVSSPLGLPWWRDLTLIRLADSNYHHPLSESGSSLDVCWATLDSGFLKSSSCEWEVAASERETGEKEGFPGWEAAMKKTGGQTVRWEWWKKLLTLIFVLISINRERTDMVQI